MPVGISLAWLLENTMTAMLIILYLAYEIHFGRLNRLAAHMDAVIDVLMAVSRTNPDLDEDAVAERLNGDSPEDLLKDE